jgi:hypothetical protein
MRVVLVPVMAVLWLGILEGGRRALVAHDWWAPLKDVHTDGEAVYTWAWAGFFLLVLPWAIWVILAFRQVLTLDGLSTRVLRRTRSVTLDRCAGIRFRPAARVVNRAQRPDRVLVQDADGRTLGQFTAQDRTWLPVLAILTEWVRRRPELPVDEATRAFFADLSTRAEP